MTESFVYRNYIYGLTDPRTGKVFYVGRTNDPSQRRAAHISSHNPDVRAKYQELQCCGLEPEMKILETIEGALGAEQQERYWILWHLKQGFELVNRALIYNNMGRRLSIEEIEHGAKWESLSAQVRPDQKERIFELARQEGRNKSELIRDLLDTALAIYQQPSMATSKQQ